MHYVSWWGSIYFYYCLSQRVYIHKAKMWNSKTPNLNYACKLHKKMTISLYYYCKRARIIIKYLLRYRCNPSLSSAALQWRTAWEYTQQSLNFYKFNVLYLKEMLCIYIDSYHLIRFISFMSVTDIDFFFFLKATYLNSSSEIRCDFYKLSEKLFYGKHQRRWKH